MRTPSAQATPRVESVWRREMSERSLPEQLRPHMEEYILSYDRVLDIGKLQRLKGRTRNR